VTAILIALNQIEPLRRAVAALEKSTERERLEILVVDLGSQDGCAQIDAEFPAVVMLRLPHNFGATKAMNISARTAKADLLFYLSPDVEVGPDTVAKLAEKLEADTDAVSRIYKLPTAATIGSGLEAVQIDLAQDVVNVEYPGRDAVLVRKQFVKGMNYFDERFGQFWADADLAAQIRRGLKKIRLYPSIAAVRSGDTSLSHEKGLLAADWAGGAASFIGKYYGFFGGLGLRVGATFKALARLDLKQFMALASGAKVDGSQDA